MSDERVLSADSWLLMPGLTHSASLHRSLLTGGYRRLGAPGPLFFILRFWEPRSAVDLGSGGRFLRAARFNLLRSALSLMCRVSKNPPQEARGLWLVACGEPDSHRSPRATGYKPQAIS